MVSQQAEAPSASMLANLAGSLDRALPVPLGTQLRGLIEFGIALGELSPGQRLPSVRELAGRANVAPMTVATVYTELRLSGLIETKPGAGTFVADGHRSDGLRSTAMRTLQRRVDRLLREAEALGLAPSLVASLVNARVARSRPTSRALRLVMVGNFLDTTQKYADRISTYSLRHLRHPGAPSRRVGEPAAGRRASGRPELHTGRRNPGSAGGH
ncbi:MAG: GntR family transcriptional regulator [Burkholderiales bacterium]|nr:GntR family transcriptional regulator [Burkholderiales bacterium]